MITDCNFVIKRNQNSLENAINGNSKHHFNRQQKLSVSHRCNRGLPSNQVAVEPHTGKVIKFEFYLVVLLLPTEKNIFAQNHSNDNKARPFNLPIRLKKLSKLYCAILNMEKKVTIVPIKGQQC